MSTWYQWATLLARESRESVKSLKLQFIEQGPSRIIRILGSKDQDMAFYLSPGPDAGRLIERLGQVPANALPNRAALIEKLAELTVTDNERIFNQVGYKTNAQIFEERFWYRFAYHCFQEFTSRPGISWRGAGAAPFVLRRLKATVLHELPEKIEDLRFCQLSEDQIRLYREALAGRGKDLLKTLKDQKSSVPFIHIFALLTLLKQICNHPALALKKIDQFEKYPSGKWELFQELLEEGLGSGQKIIVYSQFLGMIEIMERYLARTGWGFVTLTGSSQKRGERIERFNQDPECRIFLGSLKAGGVGIDLVAASMVIHYDRWWNAARENQATDRVHRIGQRRAVPYVRTQQRKKGIGTLLLLALLKESEKPILIGTWKAASWAISFYEKHGFCPVDKEEKNRLLKKYWTIPGRQVETSVVLVGEQHKTLIKFLQTKPQGHSEDSFSNG